MAKRNRVQRILIAVLALSGAAVFFFPACVSSGDREVATFDRVRFLPRETLSVEAMEKHRKTFSRLLADADFPGASALIKEINKKKLTSDQSRSLRNFRTRLRKVSFLHHHPLVLRIFSPKKTYTFAEDAPLYLEIFNLSSESLYIPSRDGWSWLPWRDARESSLVCHLRLTDIQKKDGVRIGNRWTELVDFGPGATIAPGESWRKELQLDLGNPRELIYRRIELSGELIPGGLQTGPFDWGMIRLDFSPVTLHFSLENSFAEPGNPEEEFKSALKDLAGTRLLPSAVLLEVEQRPWATEQIIRHLADFSPIGRRVALSALIWLTGQDLGSDINRWLDWWDSRAGDDSAAQTGYHPGAWIFSLVGMNLIPDPLRNTQDHESIATLEADGKAYDPIRQNLLNPYYYRRLATRKTLEAMGIQALPIIEKLLAEKDATLRRAGIEVLADVALPESTVLLRRHLDIEKDPSVQQALVQVLGLRRFSPEERQAEPPALVDSRLQKLYTDRALIAGIEDIMHYDMLPGFYDGQFKGLWPIAPGVYDRLVQIALDQDYAYPLRVLAIMALHEKKNDHLLSILLPLILDPEEELDAQFNEVLAFGTSETLILSNRRRNLSKYARFSLAKAGYPQFNVAMIKAMEGWLVKHSNRVFAETLLSSDGQPLPFDPIKHFGKNLILDIGYNYQQFDHFKGAEHWYRLMIDRFSGDQNNGYLAEAHYNMACLYAVQGQSEVALNHLKLGIDKGFTDFSWMERDKDLDSIRAFPAFKALHELIRNGPAQKNDALDEFDLDIQE